jgi:DNA-directed RNA polymerase subunit K
MMDYMDDMRDKNVYTRYEKTRIIASRVLQIAQGSPVLVKIPKNIVDPIEIAKIEWEQNMIPIDIKMDKKETANRGLKDNQEN